MQKPRVTVRELADMWGVRTSRIYELVRGGKLSRGKDGLIDTATAVAFRKAQIGRDPVRTLMKANGNGSGVTAPKVLKHINSGAELKAAIDKTRAKKRAESDTELPAEDATQQPDTNMGDDVRETLKVAAEMQSLRAQEVSERIRHRQLKTEKELGRLVSREEVDRQGEQAARIITAILNGLPAEIATIFADKDIRPMVREAVQEKVDKALFALQKAIEGATGGARDAAY